MKILGYIITMYHFVLLQKRVVTKRTTVREARQIKKYLFFISFTSANKLEVEEISQVYNYMKWMGIMKYSMMTDTVISPELSDSTACQSYPACIYCELSPQS